MSTLALATAASMTFTMQPTIELELDLGLTSAQPDTATQDRPQDRVSIDSALWPRVCCQGEGDVLPEGTPPAAVFGTKGTRRLTFKGQYGVDLRDRTDQEASVGLGMVYFMVDDFAFAPEVNVWGFWQQGQDAWGASVDLLFQWHFLKGDAWSVFGDFGCGVLGTSNAVPVDGSSFNFTPQAGLGVTFDVGPNDTRAIVGVKWHHISNASLYSNNPGRDSIVIYGALSVPW